MSQGADGPTIAFSLELAGYVRRGVTMTWERRAAAAFGLGVGYALLALEAVSPLALVLLVWLVLILVWTWRLPAAKRILGVSAAGFLAGFAAVWAVALGYELLTCQPPRCRTADPFTNVLYGVAFTAPVIALAAGELGLRHVVRKSRQV